MQCACCLELLVTGWKIWETYEKDCTMKCSEKIVKLGGILIIIVRCYLFSSQTFSFYHIIRMPGPILAC